MLVGFASSSLSCCWVLPLCWLLKTEPPISKWPLPRTANVPATGRMKVWNKSSRSTLWVMACLEPGKGSWRSDFSSMDFPLRTIKYKCTSFFPMETQRQKSLEAGKIFQENITVCKSCSCTLPRHLPLTPVQSNPSGYGDPWSDPVWLLFTSWSKEIQLISVWGIFHYVYPNNESGSHLLSLKQSRHFVLQPCI